MANTVPVAGLVLVACPGNVDADAISSCIRCIQHEGAQVKAPLQAILVTSPLELLHGDFTGIEMAMELDLPKHIVNVLFFCDHFMRHVMAYVTPDQMVKTVAKFMWQG